MAMSTQIPISPVNNDGSLDANCTQEASTPAKHRGRGKANSISKIPTPTGSSHSRSSTPDRSAPIPIRAFVPSNIPNNNTQNTPNAPITVLAIKENIADAMATDDSPSPDLKSPQLSQNHTPTITANMSSPILISKKGPCTTALSISEPTPLKNLVSPTEPNLMASPVEPPSAASQKVYTPPDIPRPMPASSYTSYMSFTHTPPHLPPSPSPPRPLPKTSQSTPLLSSQHRFSTPTPQNHSMPPPGYYEYHTINGTTTLPLSPEASESSHGSAHASSLPPVSSHEDICRSACGINVSLLCTYLLFTCSLVWLLWMSWSTITSEGVGHGGIIGSENGPATTSSYDADVPVVTPLRPRHVDDDPSGIDGMDLPNLESSGGPNNAHCPQRPQRPHHPHYPEYPEYLEDPDCPQPPANDSPHPSLRDAFNEPFVVILLHTIGIAMGVFAIISIIAILMQYDRENSI